MNEIIEAQLVEFDRIFTSNITDDSGISDGLNRINEAHRTFVEQSMRIAAQAVIDDIPGGAWVWKDNTEYELKPNLTSKWLEKGK